MRLARRAAISLPVAFSLAWLLPAAAAQACSPPFDPSVRDLEAGRVVVVGTIGDRVAGGRVFHVQRWFSGGTPSPEIVIAFREGEPVGDCSYLVSEGQALFIAPMRHADGTLSADLVTLQADPDTPQGREYLREATDLFGPGVSPLPGTDLGPARPIDPALIAAGLAMVGALGVSTLFVFAARRQRGGR